MPTDKLPQPNNIHNKYMSPYFNEERWKQSQSHIKYTVSSIILENILYCLFKQSEDDNVYSDIDDDLISAEVDNLLNRTQSSSALDAKPVKPPKPPRRSKMKKKKSEADTENYNTISSKTSSGKLKEDPYNKLLLDL